MIRTHMPPEVPQASRVCRRHPTGLYFPSQTSAGSSAQSGHWWAGNDLPGGHRLWCRLVIVFTLISVFGFIFIFISASFVSQAYIMYKQQGTSLPLVWCIIGIVSGVLMVGGSIILGKLIISSKWRKNQQPTYGHRQREPLRVEYTANPRNSDSDSNSEVHLGLPPSYESCDSIFIVTGRNVTLTASSPTTGILQLPSYSDAIKNKPPEYSQLDPIISSQNAEDNHQPVSETINQMEPANIVPTRIEVITVVANPQTRTLESPPPPYELPEYRSDTDMASTTQATHVEEDSGHDPVTSGGS